MFSLKRDALYIYYHKRDACDSGVENKTWVILTCLPIGRRRKELATAKLSCPFAGI